MPILGARTNHHAHSHPAPPLVPPSPGPKYAIASMYVGPMGKFSTANFDFIDVFLLCWHQETIPAADHPILSLPPSLPHPLPLGSTFSLLKYLPFPSHALSPSPL